MAPTVPYFRSPRPRPRPRGQCASAAITVSSCSSSASDQSLVVLSSASFSSSVAFVRAPSVRGGGGEVRGGQSSAPRRGCPPSPAPSVVEVRSSSSDGSGHAATTMSRRSTAAPYKCPSPCSVLSVRGPGGVLSVHGPGSGVVPTSLFSADDDYDGATSRPKKKYRKWALEDEVKVLSTFAELRGDNLGVPPQASVLLKKIVEDGGLARRGVDAMELADKVYKLKKKFKVTAAKLAANGHKRLRKYRNQVLLRTSMVAWPDLLPRHVMAAVQGQVARAARRHGNNAKAHL